MSITADDAAFLSAALRQLTRILDTRYQRPTPRVLELEAQLSAAARSVSGTTELSAAVPVPRWRVTDDALDVATVAEQLGCSHENVRALCRRGTLPARRQSGRWLIDAQAVADYLERKA
ncbi:hypothetical protein GCM10011588_25100 [Nocardia jinanensis]|uniref:Helix-turn-helix domain-containing protein n=1 Tax=Nocardia jinanensis TaxID=382504 RepID=A0A917RJK9_9NOCA|nr:hypothetical protein GCM10011588_25100 [Nocardia jinanensis]